MTKEIEQLLLNSKSALDQAAKEIQFQRDVNELNNIRLKTIDDMLLIAGKKGNSHGVGQVSLGQDCLDKIKNQSENIYLQLMKEK